MMSPRSLKKPRRGRPLKGDRLRARASFTLPPDLFDAIRHEARAVGKSVSELVEECLRHHLAPDRAALLSDFAELRRVTAEVVQAYDVKRIRLFGSVLHGEADSDSDIDLLVEFLAGKTPGFFQLAALSQDISRVLGNRVVDLRTPKDLSIYFRDQVLKEAVTIYEA